MRTCCTLLAMAAASAALAGNTSSRESRIDPALHDATSLLAEIPTARVSRHHVRGTPTHVRAPGGFLTKPAPDAAPEAVVAQFLDRHAALFGADARALGQARLVRRAVNRSTGVVTLWWRQQAHGLDVIDADLRASVTADGRLINISSTMVPSEALGAAGRAARRAPVESVRSGGAALGFRLEGDFDVRLAPAAATRGDLVSGPALDKPALVQQAYFPLDDGSVRPAIVIHGLRPAKSPLSHRVVIDAETGGVLQIARETLEAAEPATFRVFADPITGIPFTSPEPSLPGPDLPDGSQFPRAARELITLESIDPIASPLGWVDAPGNVTAGNNAAASTDTDRDNILDLPLPSGGPGRVFDFPLNLDGPPQASGDAIITQVFYTTNWWHDVMYGYGFTEEWGNFQNDNFDRGGFDHDAINVEIHDSFTTNNANYEPADDGLPARTQYFLFNAPEPDRDPALDATVVVHELTHGLTTRIVGLSNLLPFQSQGGGLGEGWGDFFALALLVDPSIDPAGTFTIGAYSTFGAADIGQHNNYFAFRRYPYSTRLDRNPLTFADIDPSQFSVPAFPPISGRVPPPNAVHQVGEIWCLALWEVRANLIARHGAVEGARLALQLVTDGIKLTPLLPTLLDARDAILAADGVRGGANQSEIWAGFAKRGMGFSAEANNGQSATGIVEAFDLPPAGDVRVVLVGPPPGIVRSDEATPVRVAVYASSGGTPVFKSVELCVRSGSSEICAPFSPAGAMNIHEAALPAVPCGSEIAWQVRLDTGDGVITIPSDLDQPWFVTRAFSRVGTGFEDAFETDAGWTAGPDTAASGRWERVIPIADPLTAQSDRDHTPDGERCYVTGQSGSLIDGATIITSPPIDLSGVAGAELSLWWRAFYLQRAGAANFRVQASSDGESFTTLFTFPPPGVTSFVFPVWNELRVDLAEHIDLTSNVRIRLHASGPPAGGSAATLLDLMVDDLRIAVGLCTSPADINGDGRVDSADLAQLLGSWGPCTSQCPGDLNGDGFVNAADLAQLLGSWGEA